jgi:hypothetical protein
VSPVRRLRVDNTQRSCQGRRRGCSQFAGGAELNCHHRIDSSAFNKFPRQTLDSALLKDHLINVVVIKPLPLLRDQQKGAMKSAPTPAAAAPNGAR